LLRKRGELVERSFAHCLDGGAMRRFHLREAENIEKRYLIHIAICFYCPPLGGVKPPLGGSSSEFLMQPSLGNAFLQLFLQKQRIGHWALANT